IVVDIPDDVVGAEIRLRYHVESDRRDAARASADDVKRRLLVHGALSVKVEEVVEATTRARAPEIAVAQTIADKLEVFWRAKGIEVSDEREARVFSKLTQVEEEVRHEVRRHQGARARPIPGRGRGGFGRGAGPDCCGLRGQ